MVFPFPVYNNTCTFHSLVLPCSNTLHLLVIYLFATLSTLCSCNNNNNVHLLCAYQCPERSHHTYSLNTIFYTYVEDTPTKTIYIRHYMETHTHTQLLLYYRDPLFNPCSCICLPLPVQCTGLQCTCFPLPVQSTCLPLLVQCT